MYLHKFVDDTEREIPFPFFVFPAVEVRTRQKEKQRRPASNAVRAAQLGMQMFRDRSIVKGNELLFGRKRNGTFGALGCTARPFPIEQLIARVLMPMVALR